MGLGNWKRHQKWPGDAQPRKRTKVRTDHRNWQLPLGVTHGSGWHTASPKGGRVGWLFTHSTHAFVASFTRKVSDQAPEDVAMSQKCLSVSSEISRQWRDKGEQADPSLYVVIRTWYGEEWWAGRGGKESLFRDAKNKVLSWSWSDNKDGGGRWSRLKSPVKLESPSEAREERAAADALLQRTGMQSQPCFFLYRLWLWDSYSSWI